MEEITEFLKVGAWAENAEEPEEGEENVEEAFNPEEQVHTIPLEGTCDEVFNRICTAIDPFYPKDYEEEIFRKDEDVGKIPDP